MNITKTIQAALNKDRKAEKEIYLAYAPMLFNVCRRYALDDSEAKDFLQESFIHIFNILGKYDKEKGRFEPWIIQVCIHKILNLKRANKKNVLSMATHELPERGIEEEEFDQLDDKVLLNAIRRLPTGYRNVLNLYIFENWSHKEIADILNITESASRSQLTRAKKLLKQILVQSIPDIHERKLA